MSTRHIGHHICRLNKANQKFWQFILRPYCTLCEISIFLQYTSNKIHFMLTVLFMKKFFIKFKLGNFLIYFFEKNTFKHLSVKINFFTSRACMIVVLMIDTGTKAFKFFNQPSITPRLISIKICHCVHVLNLFNTGTLCIDLPQYLLYLIHIDSSCL